MDSVFSELATKQSLGTFGFAIMVLNLIKVLQSTRAHPRVGVLVATVIMGYVLEKKMRSLFVKYGVGSWHINRIDALI